MGARLLCHLCQTPSTMHPGSVCCLRKLEEPWSPGPESLSWIWKRHSSPGSVHRTGAAPVAAAVDSNYWRRKYSLAATYLEIVKTPSTCHTPITSGASVVVCLPHLSRLSSHGKSFDQPSQSHFSLFFHSPRYFMSRSVSKRNPHYFPERVYRRVHQASWSSSRSF